MKEFLVALACWSCLYASGAAAEGSKVNQVLRDGYEHACEGSVEGIKSSGFDAEAILRDAEQDKSRLPGFVQEARDMNVDVLATYGTSISLGVAGALDTVGDPGFINDIPLVFWYVADPFGTRIAQSFEASGRENMTGTFNRVPEQVNTTAIKNFLPNFEPLGMLYNGNERNSVVKVEEIRALSQEMGFKLVALEIEPGGNGAPDPSLIRGQGSGARLGRNRFYLSRVRLLSAD